MPLAGGPPLPGEGTWEVVAATRERPAVEVAYLRPDVRNTSFITGVLRMDLLAAADGDDDGAIHGDDVNRAYRAASVGVVAR
jgi:hypothetical protein